MSDALNFIRGHSALQPRAGIVLGSGLGDFAESISGATAIPYGDIPGWPPSTAVGHAGKLVLGSIDGVPLAVMAGRAHLYEGLSAREVTFGVRVLAALGIRSLVLTNAAGAVNASYRPGDLVLISDHINLQGTNPLAGVHDPKTGGAFVDMSEAYSPMLRRTAQDVARQLGFEMPEGVYAAMLGPSYETPAEIRFLRIIGADLVGMSTVAETIVANYYGIQVLAISCATNMAAGVLNEKINHQEVLETGKRVRGRLMELLRGIVPSL